jgi:hypothetical protein
MIRKRGGTVYVNLPLKDPVTLTLDASSPSKEQLTVVVGTTISTTERP